MQIIQLSQLEKMIDDNLQNYNLELETLKNKKEYVDTIIKMKELDALIIKTMYIKENIKTLKQNNINSK
jgi:predicted nucleic acid-binding protein